jgi:hypothetical protein
VSLMVSFLLIMPAASDLPTSAAYLAVGREFCGRLSLPP